MRNLMTKTNSNSNDIQELFNDEIFFMSIKNTYIVRHFKFHFKDNKLQYLVERLAAY